MGGSFSRAAKSGASSSNTKSEDEDKLLYDLFGSLLLLQAMCDLRPISKGSVQYVISMLFSLKEELPAATDTQGSLEAWRAASEVVQMKLVPYLQKFEATPPLQSYLPKQDQSWKQFFETKLEVSETDLAHLRSFVDMCVILEVQREFKFLVLELLKDLLYPDKVAQYTKHTGQSYVPCKVERAWSNKENNSLALCDDLRPRFYLLQALCDQLPILTSTCEAAAQKRMSREISICFALLLDAAESPDRVSEVVDRFLVPYLQLQPELAKSLRNYLPKSHQSWIDFLRITLNGAEKGASKSHVQGELLKACKSLVEEFRSAYLSKVVEKIHDQSSTTFDVPKVHTEVNVFYATDRFVTEDGEYLGEHGAGSPWRKYTVLHYGVITVGIPGGKELPAQKPSENHGTKAMYMSAVDDGASTSAGRPDEGEISRTESSENNDRLKHVEILSVDTTLQADQSGFVKKILQKLDQDESDEFKREVLLYIHGYNVNHEDAIKRAAQLKYDLGFKGLVTVYSWPSKGTLWDYRHDEKMIKKSAKYLPGFIKEILTQIPDNTKVHILAHNMGNRALIKAFCKSRKVKGSRKPNIFEVDFNKNLKNVIFLAPDAKKTKFENMDLDEISSTCNFIIYSSATDLNLLLSTTFHQRTKLVNTPNLVRKYARKHCMPIDVIDITKADINMSLHHSYLCLDRDIKVLEDIIQLIHLKSPIDDPRKHHLDQKEGTTPRLFSFKKLDNVVI